MSTLGEFINTAADNLRGQGPTIRDTVIKLSQTLSALGDHSKDVFGTFKNLSTLVSALHDSTGLLEQLNRNLAAVTSLLADDPNKVGQTRRGPQRGRRRSAELRRGQPRGARHCVRQAGVDHHGAGRKPRRRRADCCTSPRRAFQNFSNIFEPANGSLTGALAVNNFANPIAFLCGAIQAASRLGSCEGSAPLHPIAGWPCRRPSTCRSCGQLPAI